MDQPVDAGEVIDELLGQIGHAGAGGRHRLRDFDRVGAGLQPWFILIDESDLTFREIDVRVAHESSLLIAG